MRHWGFCLILITVVKNHATMVPGESPCYITFHTFHTFLTFHTFHTFLTFLTFLTFHTFLTFLTFLKYLTLGFPVKPVFFWVGFLAQHGPEPPSPILLSRVRIDQFWLSQTPSRQDILLGYHFGTFYFRFKVKHAHKDRIPTFSGIKNSIIPESLLAPIR